MFELQKNSSGTAQQDNFDFLLNACNLKLASWAAQWTQEMKRGVHHFKSVCRSTLNRDADVLKPTESLSTTRSWNSFSCTSDYF